MTVKVEVDTKTFVRFLVVVAAFVFTVFIIFKLWEPLVVIAVAFFLALALNPPVSALAQKLPGHSRIMATALSYIVVLSVLGVFIYIALPSIVDQTDRFLRALPGYVQGISSQRGLVADFVVRYNLQDQLNQMVDSVQQQLASWAQGIGSSVVSGVSSVLSGAVTLLTILVLTFLMLIEGPRWTERFWSFYTNQQTLDRHRRAASLMYKVVSGYVNGQVLVATIAAAAGLITLLAITYFFNVPVGAVIPLTGLIFITDMIPMIGATIGAVIVALVLLLNDPGAMLAFVTYFIIYQQIENNFIQPLVQSRTVALSALAVFIAVILGISLMGLVGAILAIPVAGCLRVLIHDYMDHRSSKPKPSRALLAKLAKK